MFSISLKAEGKKDGLYCCEYQEGFPYNFGIKHAFLLSTGDPSSLIHSNIISRKSKGPKDSGVENEITAHVI